MYIYYTVHYNIMYTLYMHTYRSFFFLYLQIIGGKITIFVATLQEGWPGNGLEMSAKLIEAVCSFRSQVAKMTIQPHALSIMDFSTVSSQRLTKCLPSLNF